MVYFADLRLEKELKNIVLPINCVLQKSEDKNSGCHCVFIVKFDIKEGIYKNRSFDFQITIQSDYPFKAPKIRCLTYIYHPNIDDGHVCMNILREDWTSAYGLEIIIQALYTLFFTFESKDAMNVEAGDLIDSNFDMFKSKAQRSADLGNKT